MIEINKLSPEERKDLNKRCLGTYGKSIDEATWDELEHSYNLWFLYGSEGYPDVDWDYVHLMEHHKQRLNYLGNFIAEN